jgi:16S rRNA (guanine(966)-N(2))-methyltransferase RsmD
MRLTGGRAKGSRLRPLRGGAIRPTSARVREALFDILGARTQDADFLDLYAGTGAVGIEALSRGARRAVLVDSDREAARLIEANLAAGGWQAAAEVMREDAAAALEVLERREERFAIVFIDPPYAAAMPAPLLAQVAGRLSPGGVVILERPARHAELPENPIGLRPGRLYRYGDSTLRVLHRSDA